MIFFQKSYEIITLHLYLFWAHLILNQTIQEHSLDAYKPGLETD